MATGQNRTSGSKSERGSAKCVRLMPGIDIQIGLDIQLISECPGHLLGDLGVSFLTILWTRISWRRIRPQNFRDLPSSEMQLSKHT
eukprot:3362532-Karenia_brevis.AAC.1